MVKKKKKISINLSLLQFSHFRSVFHIDNKKIKKISRSDAELAQTQVSSNLNNKHTVFQQGVVLCTVQYL